MASDDLRIPIPGRLFHGTCEFGPNQQRILEGILNSGLKPERVTKVSRSPFFISASDEFVYLTSCCAPYYCCVERCAGRLVLAEVDLETLDRNLLWPDEDLYRGASVDERTVSAAKKTQRQNQDDWRRSLQQFGRVCHRGEIALASILRIVAVDWRSNPFIAHMCSVEPSCEEDLWGNIALTQWLLCRNLDKALQGRLEHFAERVGQQPPFPASEEYPLNGNPVGTAALSNNCSIVCYDRPSS